MPAPTRNGSAASFGFSGGTSTGAITHAVGGTSQSNAVMLAAIAVTSPNSTPVSVTSITDNQGNVWNRYHEEHAGAGWHTADTVNGVQRGFALEVWSTKGATIGTSIDITVNFSGTIDSSVVSFSGKFLGCNASNPFDANASLPKVLLVNGGIAAETLTGISTTTADVVGCWAFGAWGTSLSHSNPTYNSVVLDDVSALQHNNSEFVKGQISNGSGVTSVYSNVSFASPTSADNFYIFGFALTADAGAPVAPTIASAMIVG